VKLALLAMVVAGSVAGVNALADLTQSRPDHVEPGSTTVVELDVDIRGYKGDELDAARALWAVCAGTVTSTSPQPPVPADDAFTVSLTPAIGTHGRQRLVGCLEDGTLDRVQGSVLSVTTR
jgi:hypothetical protein